MMISRLLKIKDSLFTGIKEIYYHKMRSILTMSGIMLGVASLIAMMSIMNGFKQSFIEYSNAHGGNTRVSLRNLSQEERAEASKLYKVKGITLDDMKVLLDKHSDIIEVIVPRIDVGHAHVERNNKNMRVYGNNAVGVTAEMSKVEMLEIGQGRNLAPLDDISKSRVCIIGSILRDELFEEYEDPIGQKVALNDIFFTVIGTFKEIRVEPARFAKKEEKEDKDKEKSKGGKGGRGGSIMPGMKGGGGMGGKKSPKRAISSTRSKMTKSSHMGGRDLWRKYGKDNSVWYKNMKVAMPFSTVQSLFKEDDKIDSFELRMNTSENLAGQIEDMKNTLVKAHNGVEDFSFKPFAEHFEEANKQIRVMSLIFLSIAVIALFVGGIGIMNVILASISERIREIGVRKSVGAENLDIFVQFLIETTILAILGGIFGVGLGFGATRLIARFSAIRMVIPVSSIILAVGVSSCVGLIFGIYPSVKAAKLNPIDALRYE